VATLSSDLRVATEVASPVSSSDVEETAVDVDVDVDPDVDVDVKRAGSWRV
jgi:hypothetical protein